MSPDDEELLRQLADARIDEIDPDVLQAAERAKKAIADALSEDDA